MSATAPQVYIEGPLLWERGGAAAAAGTGKGPEYLRTWGSQAHIFV